MMTDEMHGQTSCVKLQAVAVVGCQLPMVPLPLLSATPAVTPATLKRAATNFAAW